MPTVLIATDNDAVADEVAAAVEDDQTTVLRVRTGVEVPSAVSEHGPDLVVLDLQIGNMGGMAVASHLRSEIAMERLDDMAILMLLDRAADIYLAKRSDADGWLFKPLDSFRLRRAATALLAGGDHHEATGIESVPPVEPTPA
ncbi:MAG TPA: response regulator [Acidimicrobiales bacterium]